MNEGVLLSLVDEVLETRFWPLTFGWLTRHAGDIPRKGLNIYITEAPFAKIRALILANS